MILQDARFDATESITICAFTTDTTDAPLLRIAVVPNDRNGLRVLSRLMVDKVTTIPKSKLGKSFGSLDETDRVRRDHAIVVFLSLTRAAHGEPT